MRDRLLLALIGLIGRLPFGAAGRLGALVGRLVYRLDSREVRNARVNLTLCFPDMPPGERERLVRENLAETGRSLGQMMRLFAGPPLDLDPLVDENGFIEAAGALIDRGKGLIIALPHLGNWEMIAYRVTRIAPATALYRPARIAALDHLIRRGRELSGITPVPTDRQGLKALHAALQRGEIVGILPDQVPKSAGASGVVAPFFGRPARTMTLVNRLARRHATPVIFCCAVYDARRHVHRFDYFEGEAAIADGSPEIGAAALNRGIERCARAHPAHYQWTYRRFELPGGDQPSPYAATGRS